MPYRIFDRVLSAALLFCLGTASAAAAEQAVSAAETPAGTETSVPLAGHSAHGAAYNEGPRQDAYLMGGTGNVHFEITTSNEEARKYFRQGLGQLHGFWFFEAERSFRRVAALDPDCAIAYWGMAYANQDNEERAREFIAAARKKMESAGERERMYITALAEYLMEDDRPEQDRRRDYVKALEKIIRAYPDDIEAKAFLAVFLWQSNRKGLPITSYAALDALLEEVFRVEPMHPAHHYRIHLWDYEEPSQALFSAARCGQAAPSIAHMWHMPGHIYSRLKRYADAAWQQEASARADHGYMMRDLVLPDQIHNYAHNNEWLIRNLIHLGRAADALDLAKNMLELPRHPKHNSFDRDDSCSCQYGRKRLIQVLETFEMWDQVVALSDTMYLEPTRIPAEQAKRWRLLGVAYHHQGRFSDADFCLDQLQNLKVSFENELTAATETESGVESNNGDGSENRARSNSSTGETEEAEEAEEDAERKQKDREKRRKRLEQGKREAENAIGELEVLRLLARGETEHAKRELAEGKGIPELRLARYRFQAGEHAKVEEMLGEAVENAQNEVLPLAVQVDLLHRMGKTEEAKSAMETLRTVTADADLDSPLLQRVKPVAELMKLPVDWRIPRRAAADVGERPELASLGPFRWGPTAAPNWNLSDSAGQMHSLDEYRGQPVLVIFYLGFGCLHCVEQIQAFAPRLQDFTDTGIDLVAISFESAESVATSIKNFNNQGTIPFPLLSDKKLDAFKAYRAYDDFEEMPLHGTFLIDERGDIRWHDIGYEPFMNVDFVLKEAARLLSLQDGTAATAVREQPPQSVADPVVAVHSE